MIEECCKICKFLKEDSTCSAHRVYLKVDNGLVQPKEFKVYSPEKIFCSRFERRDI